MSKLAVLNNAEPLSRRHGLSALLAALCLLLAATACVRFQPKPLAADKTADELEARSLTNAALRGFLETNLHHQLTPWPLPAWDLDTLTFAAFYYHPSLDVARADWRAAAGAEKTAAAIPNPTTTGSILHEPVPDAPSPWVPAINFDLPIETAGKRRFRTEQARHLSESARLNIASAAWQVRSQLRASLLAFVVAGQRLKVLGQEVALREELVGRLQSQFQAGAISAFDLNTARLALIRSRADLSDAQRLQAEARPRLAAALGLGSAGIRDTDFHFDLDVPPSAEELTTAEVRRLALLGRADILGALSDYAASQSALQLEVAKQYPDVHLSPGYSWNAGSAGEHDWMVGATVELPVFNRHEGPIAEASARRDATAARFRALQARVIGDIDAAIASFRASQTNVTAFDRLVGAQEKQQQATVSQFQAGAVDRLDLLNSELELSAVQLARLDARVKVQQALGALEDAVQRPFELPDAVFESTSNGK